MKFAGLVRELEADRIDIAEAVWWFCVDWHAGQWSKLYRVQCELGFKPSPLASGPQSREAQEIYRKLAATAKVDYMRAERIAERAVRTVRGEV